MTKYRKKPIIIEAYQTEVEQDIETPEGVMHASVGDWIITGVKGEPYPCKPDVFAATYEPLADYPPRSEYICQVIDLVAELAQEEHGAVLCHPQEPVVRCRDCKHSAFINGKNGAYFGCNQTLRAVCLEGFCAWGERVEGSEK